MYIRVVVDRVGSVATRFDPRLVPTRVGRIDMYIRVAATRVGSTTTRIELAAVMVVPAAAEVGPTKT